MQWYWYLQQQQQRQDSGSDPAPETQGVPHRQLCSAQDHPQYKAFNRVIEPKIQLAQQDLKSQERKNVVGAETDSMDTDSMDSDANSVIADTEDEKLEDLNDLINKILSLILMNCMIIIEKFWNMHIQKLQL